MKKHCRCGKKLDGAGNEMCCLQTKQKQKSSHLRNLSSMAVLPLAALSLVLKVVKDRES